MLIQKEEEEKGIIESCDYKFFKKKKFPHLGFGYFKFIYVQKKNNRCLVTKPGKPIKTAPDKLLGWLTFSLFVW